MEIKKFGLASLGLASVVYLADYLSEKNKLTPIWKYQSDPKLPFDWDKYARVVTNPLMKLFAGGIVSHHWDWFQVPDQADYSQQWFTPQDRFMEVFSTKKLTPFHHAVAHTTSGIQEVCVLGLNQEKLEERVTGYHYAFQVEGDDSISKSRILIPRDEQIRVLISTKPLRILALDSEDRELPTKIHGPFVRSDQDLKIFRQF